MRLFQNTSLRRKQTLIMMLTSSIVLLLACAAFSIYEVIAFRSTLKQNLATLADILDHNVAAALDFNDPKAAEETLSALQAEPNIIGVWLYTKNGQDFAKYDRPNDNIVFVPPAILPNGTIFQGRRLILCRPIVLKGETVGTLYLETDTQALYARLTRYAVIVGLVFLVSLLVAFVLSSKLQRLVSDPILRLAEVARSVALGKNYSVRVTKQSKDELGELVDGFNEMLVQIQTRDTALQTARENLEKRVEERTRELAKANGELQAENSERRRVEESLRLLSSAVEQSKESILITDAELDLAGPKIIFVNPAFTQMTGYTAEEAIGKTPGILQGPRTDTTVLRRLQHNFERGEMFAGETINYRKDGTEFNLESQIAPIRNASGKITHFVAIQRDITERKQAVAELENIHQQLVVASRRGGMAEIATNVLHNVGNVLNSVNISTGLIVESVKKSRASSLARVVVLLQEHAHDLGAFITHDLKGKQLPTYLAQLSEHLMAEQEAMVSELDSLRRNVEHIKEIVAMQQNYATFGGMKEMINVVNLVEDSLRMNEAALSRHHVKVVREFANVPAMNVEKHKILQILVNLIRNAKYACDESLRVDSRLTVRVANGADWVRISVIDNGIGIPPENLTRIFNHGFTTRKEGHGFGLHSGALAAKEMGGSLTVQSDGLGQGAAFTLELPCPKQENSHDK